MKIQNHGMIIDVNYLLQQKIRGTVRLPCRFKGSIQEIFNNYNQNDIDLLISECSHYELNLNTNSKTFNRYSNSILEILNIEDINKLINM